MNQYRKHFVHCLGPASLLATLVGSSALAADREHQGHDMHDMPGMHHDMAVTGMLGPYPMTREGSGTSWQPEATPMEGVHAVLGEWRVMLHGFADLVYDNQGGPRGDDKVFVPSMFMAMGQRSLGAGTLGIRTMLSLDPAMGKSGYPLLFQTGETADGVTPLIDRQHPHDLFMELATTYSVPVGSGSLFGYIGLPGEPALGPAAFMHRSSGIDLPEAPLTHHWLDSTHITFGVVTLGATTQRWKFEASAFNGREPDELRWNIEVRRLDSYAGRITFNPGESWSMQASYGYLASPEQLEPDVAVHRGTVAISNAQSFGAATWSSTLAAGVNWEQGETFPGYLLETSWHFVQPWAVFGRAEHLRTNHLLDSTSEMAEETFRVGKFSVGASRELGRAGALAFSVGALGSVYAVPDSLERLYGGHPVSVMAFVQARLAGE